MLIFFILKIYCALLQRSFLQQLTSSVIPKTSILPSTHFSEQALVIIVLPLISLTIFYEAKFFNLATKTYTYMYIHRNTAVRICTLWGSLPVRLDWMGLDNRYKNSIYFDNLPYLWNVNVILKRFQIDKIES